MYANNHSEGWLQVDQTLPPLNTRVLVSTLTATKQQIRIARYFGNNQWSAQDRAEIVTHWQPLPQFPEI